MEYVILCRTGEESLRFVDEYWTEEDGKINFTTSGSYNWARHFDDYEHAWQIANKINQRYDADGIYVYDVTVKSEDFIYEYHLHY